jgi:vacuolar-type H+-ATPase subunit H
MIENIIEQIKVSENKSKEIIQNARKQHSEIIEQAYSGSAAIEEQTKSDTEKIFKDAKDSAVSDARAEIEKLAKHYKERRTKIISSVSAKEKEAVELIIGKVFE